MPIKNLHTNIIYNNIIMSVFFLRQQYFKSYIVTPSRMQTADAEHARERVELGRCYFVSLERKEISPLYNCSKDNMMNFNF